MRVQPCPDLMKPSRRPRLAQKEIDLPLQASDQAERERDPTKTALRKGPREKEETALRLQI